MASQTTFGDYVAFVFLGALLLLPVAIVVRSFARSNPNFWPSVGRLVPFLAVAMLVISFLMPPWVHTYDRNGNYGGHTRAPAGYAWVFSPPQPKDNTGYHGVQIDVSRVLLQIAAMTVIVGASCLPLVLSRLRQK